MRLASFPPETQRGCLKASLGHSFWVCSELHGNTTKETGPAMHTAAGFVVTSLQAVRTRSLWWEFTNHGLAGLLSILVSSQPLHPQPWASAFVKKLLVSLNCFFSVIIAAIFFSNPIFSFVL